MLGHASGIFTERGHSVTGLLEPVVCLLLVCGGAAVLLGGRQIGLKLVTAAVLLPIVAAFARGAWYSAVGAIPSGPSSLQSGCDIGPGLTALGLLALVAVVVAGYVNYVNRRRQFERWRSTRPTSQKRRIERD